MAQTKFAYSIFFSYHVILTESWRNEPYVIIKVSKRGIVNIKKESTKGLSLQDVDYIRSSDQR